MLYNPTWDKKPSLSSFMLWLESKAPDEIYLWESCAACAIGQYLDAIGSNIEMREWGHYFGIANEIACQTPRTFGALSKRMKAYVG
jgi:hypothetical protein